MTGLDFDTYLDGLEARIHELESAWGALEDGPAVARRARPGGWSAKEVVGHLVDSAANNHQRFLRARWTEELRFPTYDQDEWVAAQGYQDAPWPELVRLWALFNLHIVRVLRATPAEVLTRERADHNLDRIAWAPVEPGAPVTLEWFARDYAGHLEHHVTQLQELLETP